MLAETSTSDELPHIEYHIKGAWSTDLLFLVVAAQYFALMLIDLTQQATIS